MIDIVKHEMGLRRKKEKELVEDIIHSIIDASQGGMISSEMLFDIFNPERPILEFRFNRNNYIF